ncbi:MAG: glyoxalase/bleomycin resistance protein/dioxygenase [Microbacteriaceae bacterium]|nr:glyoxalase/bleomycin resistance protein/dioxygenase [Microbacteriaceae bacterium]
MHKVTGIGGFFFRAQDPDALADWYRDTLGIDPVPMSEGDQSWRQEAGDTAFTAMAGAVDQFGSPDRAWAINFRVLDLDGMVAQLIAAGTEVAVDPEAYSMGRFASLADPEGNPIQLWEPAGE